MRDIIFTNLKEKYTSLEKTLYYSNYRDMYSLLSYLLLNNGILIDSRIRANKITLKLDRHADIASKFILDKYKINVCCENNSTIGIYLNKNTTYLNIYTLARAISISCLAMGINTSKKKN